MLSSAETDCEAGRGIKITATQKGLKQRNRVCDLLFWRLTRITPGAALLPYFLSRFPITGSLLFSVIAWGVSVFSSEVGSVRGAAPA